MLVVTFTLIVVVVTLTLIVVVVVVVVVTFIVDDLIVIVSLCSDVFTYCRWFAVCCLSWLSLSLLQLYLAVNSLLLSSSSSSSSSLPSSSSWSTYCSYYCVGVDGECMRL